MAVVWGRAMQIETGPDQTSEIVWKGEVWKVRGRYCLVETRLMVIRLCVAQLKSLQVCYHDCLLLDYAKTCVRSLPVSFIVQIQI